jgi:hypothetical protein
MISNPVLYYLLLGAAVFALVLYALRLKLAELFR